MWYYRRGAPVASIAHSILEGIFSHDMFVLRQASQHYCEHQKSVIDTLVSHIHVSGNRCALVFSLKVRFFVSFF